MKKPDKKAFGNLLVDAGMITEAQLEEVLSIQKGTGKKIGDILKERGYITQQDIIQVLEFQLGIPHVNLERTQIDTKVVEKVPENLARRHKLFAYKINQENKLVVAMSDPLNIFAVEDVKICSGLDVTTCIATEEDILKAITKYYSTQKMERAVQEYKREIDADNNQEQDNDKKTEKRDDALSRETTVSDAPIVKFVNNILEQAIERRASDVHIEAQEKYLKIRYRIDGELHEFMRQGADLLPGIIARIKIMSGMNIAEKRIPQDGRISLNTEKEEYDMRVSSLPTVHGEKIVIRINSKSSFVKDKSILGFFPDDLEKFNDLLKNPNGIILVTGPTGSGKSTSLYAALKDLNREDVNIVTVEDPVEAKVEGVNQVQINSKAGMTFASALRSILRQDPDIIMIGEIRDEETARIATTAAITGHLVLSTLHTNDAASSISRLVDMGIEPFMVGASVRGIMAQRLVRRICPKCIAEYTPEESELKLFRNEPGVKLGNNIKFAKGEGCTYCGNTGYRGRIGIYEILTITNKVERLINSNANADEIKKAVVEDGMYTLRTSAMRRVLEGQTTTAEMIRVAFSNE
jgi:type IV pilus assembly protein PilB